jgi:hypothetical protein
LSTKEKIINKLMKKFKGGNFIMGKIIDGKEEAKKLKEGIKSFVQDRVNSGSRVPCLATILVGDDVGQ